MFFYLSLIGVGFDRLSQHCLPSELAEVCRRRCPELVEGVALSLSKGIIMPKTMFLFLFFLQKHLQRISVRFNQNNQCIRDNIDVFMILIEEYEETQQCS